ncbi:protein timeless homolog isoform X2 [Tachypleus tridentatus]|uniref:protein timeless homolog isoform X2 n=1 Tax=Tachypleus tridentatus TaxID=6853 RepID=UPI003FD57B72
MSIFSSALINADLLATCHSLGSWDQKEYIKEPDCLESIKDLIRFLRRDDDTHDIRRQLGIIRVLETDLLPLLKYYPNENALFEVNLRILVNITNPALLLYHEELPEEKTTRNQYLEVVGHLQVYKQAFVDAKVWAVLTKRLGDLLQLTWEQRQEEDKTMIERILILVRNILHVPANPTEEKRTDDDVSVHDQILWSLHQSGMEDLLLYIATSEEEDQFCFHILEIISLMFREQKAEQLALCGSTRPESEKEKDIKELMNIRDQEKAEKKVNQLKLSGRHSRFGGTFCVRNVKSVSDRDLICHRILADNQFLDFDQGKAFRKKPKNRRPQQDFDVTRRSTLSIRLFLRDFCVEFLNSAYNSLMSSVKDNLSRQRAQAHDETYYLWAMRFFMEFNRLYAFNVSFVSETVSIQVFHYIHTQLEKYYEMMMTDKRKMALWSRRIHLALKAYQELLMTLAVMDKSQEEAVQKSAKIMKGNIFYMVEYRDLLLTLLMHYDEIKLPRSYLKDLVETTHVFLRMLEHQSHNNSHLIVQNKKKRSRKNKNKKKAKSDIIKSQQPSEDQLEKQWEDVSVDLSAVLRGDRTITGDVTPFDAASEKSLEDQKGDVVKKIQRALQENNAADSVALYRAARELWPEGNVFGTSNMKPEEEFMALREIFFTSIPGSETQTVERTAEETDDESEEEDDAQTRVVVTEQEFSFNDFIKRFATTKVVQSYVTLLSDYQKNTPHTNHCIVKMLHRIAWDRRMYGLLFQASAFRIFQNILHDPQRHEASSVKELARFAKFVVEKFFECAQKNKKVFMEMLFWKSSREVYEIQEGYGSFDKKQSARVLWTEEQEDELRGLYEQYKDVREGDKDVADLIVDNLIDDTKTRRQVIRHLKHLELIKDLKELCHKPTRTRVLIDWREEEEAELRQLYSQFRDTTDILGRILENLTVKRPRHRVVEKMLQMGLVNDRQQLRKKRVRKTGDKKQRKSKSKSEANDSDNDEKRLKKNSFKTR